MPLFSTLAKQGVCIINKKLHLCMLCGKGYSFIYCTSILWINRNLLSLSYIVINRILITYRKNWNNVAVNKATVTSL